ncbi:polyprenyl diphosphate synthase [Streptomyces sp. NPDC026206]|uniref:polyprenyl diphosphate synthase n=1 Tax=Streptomyces sp. NPDC026206 TaxID=3157089 RepID=UPI0033E30568
MFSSVYAKAGIHDPRLRAGYQECRRIFKRDSGTYYALGHLLPPVARPAAWALAAALRVADDLADTGPGGPDARSDRVTAWFAAYRDDLRLGDSADPVRRALVHTVRAWDLFPGGAKSMFEEQCRAPRRGSPLTWQEWTAHSRSVNSVFFGQIPLLLSRLGLPLGGHTRHVEAYHTWVQGVQLTDDLVDLHEDLARGHVTLPAEALADSGVRAEDLLAGRWPPEADDLLRSLVARGRAWLDQPELLFSAAPGLSVFVRTTAEVFLMRLCAVERAGARLLRRRPRLPRAARRRVLALGRARAAVAWWLTPLPPAPSFPPAGRPHRFTGRSPGVHLAPEPPHPPEPHPSGARPPTIAPGLLPRHVAIVMDGNGRWANDRGLPRTAGHRAGADALRDVVHGALEIGLPHLTVYAFSTENWSRSAAEVDAIMALLREHLHDDEPMRLDVRARWSGVPDGLPVDLVQALLEREHATSHRTGLILTVCANYGGRSEIAQAAGAFARAAVAGHVDPARVSEQQLARYLPLPDLPDVDLLWRTGGEQRTSNFLPWQSTYAELLFTDGYWPDTDRRDLWRAMAAYAQRQRRYGAAPPGPQAPGPQVPGLRP